MQEDFSDGKKIMIIPKIENVRDKVEEKFIDKINQSIDKLSADFNWENKVIEEEDTLDEEVISKKLIINLETPKGDEITDVNSFSLRKSMNKQDFETINELDEKLFDE
jgi:hypothetical protein